jgi:hypothetical protein
MGSACNTYGEKRKSYNILVGNFEGKNNLEDIGMDGRITL